MTFFEGKPMPPGSQYRGVEEIENWGNGTVWRARHVKTGKDVLVKTTWDTSSEGSAFYEKQQQRHIDHPNLPQIIDSCYQDGPSTIGHGQFFIFPWTGKDTLGQSVKNNPPMAYRDAVKLLLPICEALETLHEPLNDKVPIYHHHLSPEAIVIWQGKPMLREYGLSRVFPGHLRQDGIKFLKQGYAAQEQYDPGFEADGRADVYAMGAIYYYMLTKPASTSLENGNGDDTADRLWNADVPESVKNVINKAMSYYVAERYQTIAEFRKALEAALKKTEVNSGCGTVAVVFIIIFILIALFSSLNGGSSPNNIPPTSAESVSQQNTLLPPTEAGLGGGVQQRELSPLTLPALPALDGAVLTEIAGMPKGTGYTPHLAANNQAVANFYLSGYFNLPAASGWDIEYIFRETPAGHYQLSIGSDNRWILEYMTPGENGVPVTVNSVSGEIPAGIFAPGSPMGVQVVVLNDKGWLFINQVLAAEMSLVIIPENGDIEIQHGQHPYLAPINPIPFEKVTISRLD